MVDNRSNPPPEYTSPTDEQLKHNLPKRDIEFIKDVRHGKSELFGLNKHKIDKFGKLQSDGFIKCGFALLNPRLFCDYGKQARLYFLFFRAEPENYFDVKAWIKDNKDRFNFSAYTTLGPYDFVIRLVASEDDIKEICNQLKSKFNLSEETKLDSLPDLLKITVDIPICYDKVYPIGTSAPNIDTLSQIERRFLLAINEHIDFDRLDNGDNSNPKSLYNYLKEQNYLLGTRCIIDSPRMNNIIAFILVDYRKIDQIHEILTSDEADLKKNIIDAFKITSSIQYSALLVCEFYGANSNALYKYNKWMDDFYWYIKTPCLTFTSDSTICEFPDIYESSRKLKEAINKYYSPEEGIMLGQGVWFGKEQPDLVAKMDYQSFIHNAFIAGLSGSGKTNTCLYIVKELVSKNIKVLYISFKGESSINEQDIAKCNGESVSGGDFLKINSLELIKNGVSFVQTNIGTEGKSIALHCFDLIINLLKVGADGRQKSLSYVIILDEILNITENLDDLLAKLLPILKTCREQGIGIIIPTQDIYGGEKILTHCANKFFHQISGRDINSVMINRLSPILGLSGDNLKELQSLAQGYVVCNPVTRDGQSIQPIVVKVPLIKK